MTHPHDEVIGRNCRFLQVAGSDQPELNKLRAAMKNEESIEVNLRIYLKDGELFYTRPVVKPLFDGKGSLIYFLSVEYHITQQIKAQQEINKLSTQLLKMVIHGKGWAARSRLLCAATGACRHDNMTAARCSSTS